MPTTAIPCPLWCEHPFGHEHDCESIRRWCRSRPSVGDIPDEVDIVVHVAVGWHCQAGANRFDPHLSGVSDHLSAVQCGCTGPRAGATHLVSRRLVDELVPVEAQPGLHREQQDSCE